MLRYSELTPENFFTFHTEILVFIHWGIRLHFWVKIAKIFPWTVLKAWASGVSVTIAGTRRNAGNWRNASNRSWSLDITSVVEIRGWTCFCGRSWWGKSLGKPCNCFSSRSNLPNKKTQEMSALYNMIDHLSHKNQNLDTLRQLVGTPC